MLMYLTIIDSKEGQQKFEFIYNRYKKLMFYIANKILGDTRDSEDMRSFWIRSLLTLLRLI